MNEILNGFDFSGLRDILIRVIPSLLCITLHELAHGFTAYALGDDTAKKAGRLTLNPIKHLDPMGLLMMVLFRFGYAKPVPVNMMKFREPKRGMALTAFAGPLCNVVIAVVFTFLYGLFLPMLYTKGTVAETVLDMLWTTAYLSLAMGVFNLLPIPPLDGSKVLFSLLPDNGYLKLMQIERYGFLILAALLYTGVLSRPLSWLVTRGLQLLNPLYEWGLNLGLKFI